MMEKIASRNSFTEIYELVARLMFFAVVTVSLFLTSNLCKIYFHWPMVLWDRESERFSRSRARHNLAILKYEDRLYVFRSMHSRKGLPI